VRRGDSLDKLRFCSNAEVALHGGPAVTAEDRYRREMSGVNAYRQLGPARAQAASPRASMPQ
jgi:hypothetical protein